MQFEIPGIHGAASPYLLSFAIRTGLVHIAYEYRRNWSGDLSWATSIAFEDTPQQGGLVEPAARQMAGLRPPRPLWPPSRTRSATAFLCGSARSLRPARDLGRFRAPRNPNLAAVRICHRITNRRSGARTPEFATNSRRDAVEKAAGHHDQGRGLGEGNVVGQSRPIFSS